jgi:glycosyltransferase involved in cell wall biosynthesis
MVIIVALSVSSILASPSFIVLVFLYVCLLRILNLYRIATGKMQRQELHRRFKATAFWLGLASTLILLLSVLSSQMLLEHSIILVSFVLALTVFINTIYSLRKWSAREFDTLIESELPTVSVCIPARNETIDLPDCVESVLSSTYPKLEILVLDDCSHDKTPAIIKSYAQRGVRFIRGEEPDDHWLAKNQALDKLFLESKGDIVIFTGVDTRFSPDTVTQMVANMQNEIKMIGILPRRNTASELSVFIQPLRYWWEIAVPRFFNSRPPVLSTCWAIHRNALNKLGGFSSFKNSVQPEAHFAKRLKLNYRFIISGNRLGVTSVKPPRDQFDSAIRTRYPQTKRRPETVMSITFFELILFFAPLFILIKSIVGNEFNVLTAISLAIVILLAVINILITRLVVSKSWILSIFSLPFLIAEEWYVMHRSMLSYEFGIVIWKERNICLPMLQAEKELPKI